MATIAPTTSSATIQPVNAPDLPILADMVTASKMDLSINRVLWKDWPNLALQKSKTFSAVSGGFGAEPSGHFKLVADDGTGEMLGYLVFMRKKAVEQVVEEEKGKDEEGEGQKPEWEAYLRGDVVEAIGEAAGRIEGAVSGMERIEIISINIKEGHRGRGLGTQLMGVAFEKARAEGIPVVVQATTGNEEFFLKLGFEETRHADLDLAKWESGSRLGMFRMTGMVWRP